MVLHCPALLASEGLPLPLPAATLLPWHPSTTPLTFSRMSTPQIPENCHSADAHCPPGLIPSPPDLPRVPFRAGSFCSSRFLLRLKREELCRRSFLTIWGPPEYLILLSCVGGGVLLLGRLLDDGGWGCGWGWGCGCGWAWSNKHFTEVHPPSSASHPWPGPLPRLQPPLQ